MDRDDLLRCIIQAVIQTQEASGRSIGEIGPDTRPLKDLQGFDSLSGVEATVLLSEAVGCELPDSVFAPQAGNRVLSVNEIGDRVLDCMAAVQVSK